ncbi:MAG: 9-O-acetylesterase [Kiritimatiellaeota bacterium]|nr:9-O-acetylesterase [Kiritimatiellota bacterium]
MKKLWMTAILLCMAVTTYADVTVNGLFTDYMVLQRDIPVSVYGMAEPKEKVTVTFSGQEKSAVADKDGNWSVKLAALKASTNTATLTVLGKNTVTLKDVAVGDVWVCSGQSNMELLLAHCGSSGDTKEANYPLIRQFDVHHNFSGWRQPDVKGNWVSCTPQTAGNFTAVGYYFGRKIHRETGIPIGLVRSISSGTSIEPFCSADGLASIPELAKDKARLDLLMVEYRSNVSNALSKIETYLADARKALASNAELPDTVKISGEPATGPCDWHCMYNGMIHPLVNFRIKGALFYQGETNGSEEDGYYHKMRALIGGWRKAWNQGDFPFYFVQLPNYSNPGNKPEGGDGWAKTRMGQFKALAIPNTGMAVTIELADVGNPGNVHPGNKRDVGERLALWALAKDYGQKNLVFSGPLYREMKIENNKIRLVFDSVGSGLTVATKKGYDPVVKEPQGKLQKFAIAGEDKKWAWADAVIDGKTVLVSSPEVPKPVAVRYAFAINPDGCNLYNNEGLPASPFRTDAW